MRTVTCCFVFPLIAELMNWDWVEQSLKLSFKAKSVADKLRLERECIELINKYELECCDTAREFIDKFEALPALEKTKFLKCYPDIFEYLEHAESQPGVPFRRTR